MLCLKKKMMCAGTLLAGLLLSSGRPSWAEPSTAPAVAPASPAVQRLSLSELWRRTEGRNPTLRANLESISGARYTRDEQRWLALPSGDLSAYLSWSPQINCASQPTDPASPTYAHDKTAADFCLATSATGNLLNDGIRAYLPIYGALFRLNINIIQPIFTFGKLSAARGLGNVGLELAQAQAAGTRADLAVNLVRAFFGIKAARAALDTVKDGQVQIIKWIDQIDRELESGKSGYTEIDLMRMKVAESQVQIGVVDLERTVASALAGLRYLAQDPTVDVDDSDLSVSQPELLPLDSYLDAALKNRPEMKQLNATGQGAQLYRKLRIAEFFPDVGVLVNFAYNIATSVQDPPGAFMNRLNGLGAAIGLGLRMNLDFGPKAARLQKALADVRLYDAKRQEALGGGAVEIERAYNDAVEARGRLAAAEKAEKRARGWMQGIKQAIDVGTAESRDMLDALRAYYDQHIAVLRSVNDVNVQTAVLHRLSGIEVIPHDP